MALYYLVAGNLPAAKGMYQTALQHNPSPTCIRDALRDLEDLLQVFPNQTAAQQAKAILEKKLKENQSS